MPVPSLMQDLSATAASNSPAGTDPVGNQLDDYLRAIQAIIRHTQTKGADIASAATVDLSAATGAIVTITGSVTITSLGTVSAGITRTLLFTGTPQLTHSSNLQLPGSINYVAAIGDVAEFVSLGAGQWVCKMIQYSNGLIRDSSGNLRFIAAGSERARIATATGSMLIGTTTDDALNALQVSGSGYFSTGFVSGSTSAGAKLSFSGVTPATQTHGTSASASSPLFARWSADANGPNLYFFKGRTTTYNSHTTPVADGDSLMGLYVAGSDGSTVSGVKATLTSEAGGAWSTTSTPTRLAFFTVASGSTTHTRRMVIESTGNVLIGTTTDDGTNKLQVNGAAKFGSTGVVTVATDGRMYGSALHNNAGAMTGTVNQYIGSGTYTPTIANQINVVSSVLYELQWLRVGNVVTVSGRVRIRPSVAATSTTFTLTLPIASAFVAEENLGGAGVFDDGSTTQIPVNIYADSTNDVAAFKFISNTTGAQLDLAFSFTYLVL